jgi:hypothetical protein
MSKLGRRSLESMMRKRVVMLMAVLFSLSVSGLGFAAEEKKPATTAPAAEKLAPSIPPASAKQLKKAKKAKKGDASHSEGAGTMAPMEKPAAPAASEPKGTPPPPRPFDPKGLDRR